MLTAIWRDWLNPLQGNPYAFWSGIGSGSPILAAIAIYTRHHTCEQPGCWRLGHPHPDHGRPICRHHYITSAISALNQGGEGTE